ncbi:MAG: hypothetical protein KKB31_07050 [Nanoarchaeota archaeon]|nr:hypothetical protein [Nanoarchaeota archaeon]
MNRKTFNGRGQQEIVGFVLIVVLVVVGLMVFMIISLRESPEEVNSVEVDNLIGAMMKYTTECAITFEPEYDSMEDLFKSCYQEKQCSNLGKDSCEYLDEKLREIMDALVKSEASISAYQVDFVERDSEGLEMGKLQIIEGNCDNGLISSAQQTISAGQEKLVVRIKLCKEAS